MCVCGGACAPHMSPGCVDVVTSNTLISNDLSDLKHSQGRLRSWWSAQGSDWVWAALLAPNAAAQPGPVTGLL